MENLIAALVIAVVQGITEWVPVSSSGHLVIFERLLGYSGGMMFDVALHFGTLMAVFVYFGKDITDIIEDLLKWRRGSKNSKLGLLLIIATLPAALIGFLLRPFFESAYGNLGITALGFGVTGLFLFISSLGFRGKGKFGYGKSFLVGCAQILSLFPGVSRSGATISSGLLFGLNEKDAVKFSFLMSIPIVFGANILAIGSKTLPPELIWATMVSFFVGLLSIHFVYRYILTSRKSLRWFGLYALVLAFGIGVFVLF